MILKEDIQRMLLGSRGQPCFQAVLAWIDHRVSVLHRKLETAAADKVPHCQGAIGELRQLRKIMLGQPQDNANRDDRSE